MATDKETLTQALGSFGFKVIDTVGTITDRFMAVKPITDTATFSCTSRVGDDFPSTAIALGDIINGSFSSVTLTSGKVIAYYDIN